MTRVLIVATSRKTRGGITAVIKAHEKGEQWNQYHCHWVQTHRDGPNWRKLLYLMGAWADYVCRLPFYDIVHIHFSLQTTAKRKKPFVKLAKFLGKKVVIHLHCGSQIHDIWNSDYDYLFRTADISVMLSENLREMVESHTGKGNDYRVIYNPCPVVAREPVLPKKKTVLFSGTMYEGKGYKDLIKAFSKISPSFPDWKVQFAGNGELEEAMDLANETGVGDHIELLGWVSGETKDRAFREASVFCLPSYAEGFPMAVLDAWAYGLPVITTPVGGIPDVAANGTNMLLFDPGDIDTLASQLSALISSDELREKISLESRRFASGMFSLDTINAQIGNMYKDLLKK